MITFKEIKSFSEKLGVPAATIDKDWVLGHLLAGIFDNAYFQEKLIFKGGTCLKKCYFENYRFSEDLDFTSIHISKKKLISNIKKVIRKIDFTTEIKFGKIQINDKNFKNNLAAYECTIRFWGAGHPQNKERPPEKRWTTSIKMDFTLYEAICFKQEKKQIIHPYSDMLSNHFVSCYSIEEIVSEKLRSLLQRNYAAPRDYYDLWYIMKNIDAIKWEKVSTCFKKNCDYKNITCDSANDFFNTHKTTATKKEWQNSLSHHLKTVPVFDIVITELSQKLKTRVTTF